MEKGLCENNIRVRGLCELLKDEGMPHLNSVLDMIENKMHLSDVNLYFNCARNHCGMTYLHRFFEYMKYYLDFPEIQDKINDPEFPLPLLERYIFYLHRQEILNEGNPDKVLDKYLPFLSQQKLVDLMTNTELLAKDHEFFLQIFAELENRYIDVLLGARPDLRYEMTDMFMRFPDAIIEHLVSRNPLLYRYILLFLELDGRMKEADDFTGKFGATGSETDAVETLLDIVEKIRLDLTGNLSKDRGLKVSIFASLILGTPDPVATLEALERASAFSDEEMHFIRKLVVDENTRKMLNFNIKNIDIKELRLWTENDSRPANRMILNTGW